MTSEDLKSRMSYFRETVDLTDVDARKLCIDGDNTVYYAYM